MQTDFTKPKKPKKPKKVTGAKITKAKKPKAVKSAKAIKHKQKTISKRDREVQNKINQLKRSIKQGKDFHYGKKKFKNEDSARRYLEQRLLQRKLKGNKEARENLREINKINKELESKKKDNEAYKNLRSLFPKGIKIPKNLTGKQLARYLEDIKARASRISSHEVFARLQSIQNAIGNKSFDAFAISDRLNNLMPLMTNEELDELEELIYGFYTLLNSGELTDEEVLDTMRQELNAFIDKFIERHSKDDTEIANDKDIVALKELLNVNVESAKFE